MTTTPAQKLTQTFEEQMFQQQMSQMSKDVNKVFTALCVENDQVLGKIPESVFQGYFLPYFSGELSMADTTVVGQWVGIAGTPAAEVRIIDDATGAELYRVPPLLFTQFLDVQTRPRGMPMKDVFEHAAMHRQNIPIQGERYLEAAYNDKAAVLLRASEMPDEYRVRWETIMRRYGKTQVIAEPAAVATTMDDAIDYDAEV